MITLLTGAPGAAKTLYTVDKIVRPMIGSFVQCEPDEDDIDADWTADEKPPATFIERKVLTNIKRFLLDHELIDNRWLLNIHTDTRPGALVVFDEVQRAWPNRPTGSKKPESVEFLETHRHEGMDLVIITQNPQLLDPAVRSLVGRHLHVRKVAMLPMAIIYEWDSCSSSLNFKSAFARKPYRYNRAAYKLYKSAKLHIPQKRSLPVALWFAIFGMAGAAYAWPALASRILERANPTPPAKSEPLILPDQQPQPLAPPLPGQDQSAPGQERPMAETPQFPAVPGTAQLSPAIPVFSGCIRVRTACECFDTQGFKVKADPQQCIESTSPHPVQLGTSTKSAPAYPAQQLLDVTMPPRATAPGSLADGQIIATMRSRP